MRIPTPILTGILAATGLLSAVASAQYGTTGTTGTTGTSGTTGTTTAGGTGTTGSTGAGAGGNAIGAPAGFVGGLAPERQFSAVLSGAQELPPTGSSGEGTFVISFDQALAAATYSLAISGLSTPTGAHLHCGRAGENGPIVVDLMNTTPSVAALPTGPGASGAIGNANVTAPQGSGSNTNTTGGSAGGGGGTTTNQNGTITNPTGGTTTVTATTCAVPLNNIASLYAAMREGWIYVNVHTAANPNGEIRAQLFPSPAGAQVISGFLGFPQLPAQAQGNPPASGTTGSGTGSENGAGVGTMGGM